MSSSSIAGVGVPSVCGELGMQSRHDFVAVNFSHKRRGGNLWHQSVGLDKTVYPSRPIITYMRRYPAVDDILLSAHSAYELRKCLSIGPTNAALIDHIDRNSNNL